MKIVYLNPVSGFNNTLSSDTLWGLLCWGIRHIYGEEVLLSFIKSYSDTSRKPLLVTSAFRFITQGDKKKLFFPKPTLPTFTWSELTKDIKVKSKLTEIYSKVKKFKKLKMLDFEQYLRVLSGELTDYDLLDAKTSNYKDHFTGVDIQHNTIDRYNGSTIDGSLFEKSVEFSKNSGIYFLVEGEEEQINLIEGALRYFEVNGFAGDSATGTNHFRIEIEEFTGFPVNKFNAYTNLSLVIPSKEEITLFKKNTSLFYYDMAIRKGKIWQGSLKAGSDFWKPSVITFREGSLFPAEGVQQIGSVKKIVERGNQSPHDIYHYGLGFLVPVYIKGFEK
ncbi:MAG: type III-A CRISPR-associated RAMP protein Csm4 [Ignavibacteriaceae bacterium]|nr:type III-A CRISPR-associated RAMP protein Csm4 [Ignavibacteriaceae bacterium]